MRKRSRRVRQSKLENNPSPPMKASKRSAVLACPSPYDVEDTTQKPPPLEAWPEIVQSNRFCVLPTVGALYIPIATFTFTQSQNSALSYEPDDVTARKHELWDGYIDKVVKIIPTLEPYKAQIFPIIREVYQENIGTPLPETFIDAVAYAPYYVLKIFNAFILEAFSRLDASKQMEVMNIMTQSVGLINFFNNAHESMHLFSFNVTRHATVEFRERAQELFDLLLQQSDTNTQNSFWGKFNELNDRLMDCLSAPFALEEMRATLGALLSFPSETQQRIITQVYPKKRQDREAQFFRKLRSLTSDDWQVAWELTFLVEYLNPADPQSELEKLISNLTA